MNTSSTKIELTVYSNAITFITAKRWEREWQTIEKFAEY